MTTVTLRDRIPLEEISERASQVKPGRTLLLLIGALLFGLGFLFAKVFVVAFRSGAWTWAALRVGFEAAHGPTRGQQLARLAEENRLLRMENARLGG